MHRFAYIACATFLLWLSVAALTPLAAQVLEVSGGNSSLYQAGGGSLTVHSSGYDFTLGAGTVDGRLLEGGRVLRATPRGTWILGDDRIDFRLPTDIFDTSHYLLARGVGFSGVRGKLDIVAFAGQLSTEYSSPLFTGAKAGEPTGVLFLKRALNPRWRLFSDTVAGAKLTQIEALQWSPAAKTEVAFAVGVGANQPFGAVSVRTSRPRFDVQGEYIAAGQQFHRIAAPSLELAEPDRENILVTVRPWSFVSFTGSRQNYLVPLSNSLGAVTAKNARSSINQFSASLHLLGAQVNGTLYRSSYNATSVQASLTGQAGMPSESNHAAALTMSRDFTSRLHWNSSYLAARPKGIRGTDSFLSTFTETLTARLSVSQTMTYSNGQSSVNFGGQFVSNTLSLSATYDTFYVPAENSHPFEQAILLDVKLKVLGRLLVHGASFVDPTGRLRYTADANTVFSHERGSQPVEHVALGKYILHGCVTDASGAPVEGAAVLIDEMPLYTDSSGCFYLRESSGRTHRLRVVIGEFLAGGNWQIVSMPMTVTSATEDKSEAMKVVVVVRRVREISTNQDQPGRQDQSAQPAEASTAR